MMMMMMLVYLLCFVDPKRQTPYLDLPVSHAHVDLVRLGEILDAQQEHSNEGIEVEPWMFIIPNLS
jgi:hypothetical protein